MTELVADKPCDYCEQTPTVEIDCLGGLCCADCWEDMKDWTLEQQAELDELSKGLTDGWEEEIVAIKAENGIPSEVNCIVCFGCRKPVRFGPDDSMSCDCTPEQLQKSMVPIPDRFLKDRKSK